jgi:hypothetical protein
MSGVPWGEAFPYEHMAQVAPAPSALDLDSLSVGIGKSAHRPGDLLVERRPAAVGLELVFRTVERSAALLALVDPGFEVAFVLTGERSLGPFVENDLLLRPVERLKHGLVGLGHARRTSARPITWRSSPRGSLQ